MAFRILENARISPTAVYEYDITGRLIGTRVYDLAATSSAEDSLLYAVNYSYDSLGRLKAKTLSTDIPLNYNYTYWLSKRNGTDETLYKTTQLAKELIGDIGYYYVYDRMGNITEVREGPVERHRPQTSPA